MKKKQLTASALRVILSVTLFVILALAIAAFYIVNSKLQTVATDVSHTVIDADASQNNLQSLQLVQKELVKQKDAIDRTSSIVADSQSYQYQDQIIADINDYARKSGLTITSLDFTAATAPPAAVKPVPGATAGPVTPAGVKSTSVAVTLDNPVDYNSLLTFIKLTEQNLTKMQITKIGLSRDPTTGKMTSDILTIEVYIR